MDIAWEEFVVDKLPPGRPMGNALVTAQRRAAWTDEIFQTLQSAPETTFVAIAEQMGISVGRVGELYRQELAKLPRKSVEQARELMLLDIADARDKALEIMHASHPYVSEGRVVYMVTGHDADGKPIYADEPLQDSKGPLQAINTLMSVLKRATDLLGTDAPKKSEVISAHVTAADLRVTKIVDSLRVENDGQRKAIEARVGARRVASPGEVVDASQFGPLRRPHGAAMRRRAGLGASPARVRTWKPDELFE